MPLHGLRWFAGAAVAASGIIGACGYPDFTYDNGPGGGRTSSSSTSSSTSASGGQAGATSTSVSTGGSGGLGGSTTASSASTGGGGAGPTVPCTQAGTMCKPQEVCCFHDTDESCDECTSYLNTCGDDEMGSCGGMNNFVRFVCNEDSDCPAQKVCCVATDGVSVTGISCFTSCDNVNNFPTCDPANDNCQGSTSCQSVGYPGYYTCQ